MKIQKAATPITTLSILCIVLIVFIAISSIISSVFISSRTTLLHKTYHVRFLLHDLRQGSKLLDIKPEILSQLDENLQAITQYPSYRFFWQGSAIKALQISLDASCLNFKQALSQPSNDKDSIVIFPLCLQVMQDCDLLLLELSKFQEANAFNCWALYLMLVICCVILLYILYYSRHFIRDKLAFQASHDALTKLLNRNVYDELVETEIARSERYKYTMSLILFDIDHFKKVNDTYGHDVGDIVLVQLAQLVKNQIRMSDSLFRTGGEEFAIIAPETGTKPALFLAEKLRSAINETTFGENNRVTVSFGLAEYINHEGPAKLFHRADQALYKAKNSGRNRVEVAL